jgi:hypothetical protein
VLLIQKARTTNNDDYDDGNQNACAEFTKYHSSNVHEPIIEPALPSNSDEVEDMTQFSSTNHRAQGLGNSQDVFLGVAWVLPREKRLLQLFLLLFT